MTGARYKLDELAHAGKMSARTVRYYVQRGLLPAPAFHGKDTAYGHEHLVRLRAIRRLQDAYLPLDAIAVELGRRTLDEIERIADGLDLPTPAAPPSPPEARERDEPPVRWRSMKRIELAPGVELALAEDAPAESRAIAERVLESFLKEQRRA